MRRTSDDIRFRDLEESRPSDGQEQDKSYLTESLQIAVSAA